MKTPLVLRYFLWSMLIFAVSMFSLSFRVFDSMQYKTLALGGGLRTGSYWRTMKEIDLPYRIFHIYGPQISQERYFEIAREVVHRLKVVGTKVVIVPIPDFFLLSPRTSKTIKEIAADSIAIFATEGVFNSSLPWERDLRIENKNEWWTKHPFYNRLKAPWGVMSPAIKDHTPLIRFVPVGFRESETGAPVSDVATIALRRYLAIPDGEEIPVSRSRVSVGPLGIQIGQDGISYLRAAYYPKRESELWVGLDMVSDSLQYFPSFSDVTVEQAWLNHNGKIVMVDWDGSRRSQDVPYGGAYLQIFGSVFKGSFLTIHNEWNVLLITTLVVLLSVFSYAVRNGWTVFLSVLLSVASVVISGWLFIEHNVVFEPMYIIVPILLCGLILPLVKMAGEKTLAEEKIKSLEEENRRLLDLQRPSSPQVLP